MGVLLIKEKLRLPWSTWVLTRILSGQLRTSLLLPLRPSSLEMVISPKKRLLVPLLPGLILKVLPFHKKHGTSWKLLSIMLMPTVMVHLPLMSFTQLSLRKRQLHHKEEEKEEEEKLFLSFANTEHSAQSVTYAARVIFRQAYTCYINTGFFN